RLVSLPPLAVAPCLAGGLVGPLRDHEVAAAPVGGSQQLEALESGGFLHRPLTLCEAPLELLAGPVGHGDDVDPHDAHASTISPATDRRAPVVAERTTRHHSAQAT